MIFRRAMTLRRPFTNMYQQLFVGNFFSCNDLGHKEINCRDYTRNDIMRNRSSYNAPKYNYMNNKNGNPHGNGNYGSFTPLVNFNIECYKCNNFGHKAHDCRSLIKYDLISNENKVPLKIWKTKQEEKHMEEFELALHSQKKEIQWYIESGCSKIMTRDHKKSISLMK